MLRNRTLRLTFAAALVVLVGCTPPPASAVLYVDPVLGSDSSSGSQAAPLATLTEALTRASAGWTINLADGVYDESTGEVWPLQTGFPPVATPNVPAGVTIAGSSNGGSILAGPGGATPAAALVFEGAATVRDVQVRYFERALLASDPGPLLLTRVMAYSNSIDGLLAYGAAEVSIEDSVFSNNGLSGVAVFGEADLRFEVGTLSHNRTGLYATDQSKVHVVGVEISHNGTQQMEAHAGVYLVGSAYVELHDVLIAHNAYGGIEVWNDVTLTVAVASIESNWIGLLGQQSYGELGVVLLDSQLAHNTLGIWWWTQEASGLVVRGSQVRQSAQVGVMISGDPGYVDFGADGTPGGNEISDNTAQVVDERLARPAADGPVPTFSASALVPDTVPCAPYLVAVTYTGPTLISCHSVQVLQISNSNNRVRFAGN